MTIHLMTSASSGQTQNAIAVGVAHHLELPGGGVPHADAHRWVADKGAGAADRRVRREEERPGDEHDSDDEDVARVAHDRLELPEGHLRRR